MLGRAISVRDRGRLALDPLTGLRLTDIGWNRHPYTSIFMCCLILLGTYCIKPAHMSNSIAMTLDESTGAAEPCSSLLILCARIASYHGIDRVRSSADLSGRRVAPFS